MERMEADRKRTMSASVMSKSAQDSVTRTRDVDWEETVVDRRSAAEKLFGSLDDDDD